MLNISNTSVGANNNPLDFILDSVSAIGNKIIKAIKYVKNSIVVDVASKIATLASDIIKGAASILPKICPNEVIKQIKTEVEKAKKFTVFTLVTVPFSLLSIGSKFLDFIKEAYHFCRTGNRGQITNVTLLALAAIGDLLELPSKVAHGVALFIEVPLKLWTTVLSTVASVFSVASIVYSVKSHIESTKVIKEMESAKNKALLTHLKNALPSINISVNKAFLLSEIEKALKVENLSELPSVVKTFLEVDGKKNSQLVNDALFAGKMGSLKILKDRDDAFLSKHFCVEGEKIKSALTAIEKSNNHKKIDDLCDLLKSRIISKQLSDKLSVVADTVTLVAGILFIVLEFGVACSPLAPIAYSLLIATGSFAIIKAIVEYVYKKRAEAKLKGL